MGLISVSQVSDGNTASAADINGPINAIVAAINGNLDSNNLATNAVSTAKVQDAAVTAVKLGLTPTTFANTGTAGGTFSYINLGGIKLLWGVGAGQGIGAGAQVTQTVIFPTSFFSTTPTYLVASPYGLGTVPNQNVWASGATSSQVSIGYYNPGGSTGTLSAMLLVIGT